MSEAMTLMEEVLNTLKETVNESVEKGILIMPVVLIFKRESE